MSMYVPFTLCVYVCTHAYAQVCALGYPPKSLLCQFLLQDTDKRQKVVHGKFQLDRRKKNTRKVVRHWNRGLER